MNMRGKAKTEYKQTTPRRSTKQPFAALLEGCGVVQILFCIDMLQSAYGNNAVQDCSLVDFVVCVTEDGSVFRDSV